MDIVKLGKKGQIPLLAGVLRKLGLQGSATLIVEATDDGAVVLRPAAVLPGGALQRREGPRVRGRESRHGSRVRARDFFLYAAQSLLSQPPYRGD